MTDSNIGKRNNYLHYNLDSVSSKEREDEFIAFTKESSKEFIKLINDFNSCCKILSKSIYGQKQFKNMACQLSFSYSVNDNNYITYRFEGVHGENYIDPNGFAVMEEIPLVGEMEIADNYIRLSFNGEYCEEYKLIKNSEELYVINALYQFMPINYVEGRNILVGVRVAKIDKHLNTVNLPNALVSNSHKIEWKNIDISKTTFSDYENLDKIFEDTGHTK